MIPAKVTDVLDKFQSTLSKQEAQEKHIKETRATLEETRAEIEKVFQREGFKIDWQWGTVKNSLGNIVYKLKDSLL